MYDSRHHPASARFHHDLGPGEPMVSLDSVQRGLQAATVQADKKMSRAPQKPSANLFENAPALLFTF